MTKTRNLRIPVLYFNYFVLSVISFTPGLLVSKYVLRDPPLYNTVF